MQEAKPLSQDCTLFLLITFEWMRIFGMLMDIDNQNKIPFTFFKNLKKETCTAHESHESTCQIPTFQLLWFPRFQCS